MIDRSRVEELVRTTLLELGRTPPVEAHGALLLKNDRGTSPAFDQDAMRSMLQSTPARIGVGRAGTRYRTNTLLRFRADHAAAKDAVLSEVDPKLVEKLGLIELTIRAPDKPIFLVRPDADRALSEDGKKKLEGCVK